MNRLSLSNGALLALHVCVGASAVFVLFLPLTEANKINILKLKIRR